MKRRHRFLSLLLLPAALLLGSSLNFPLRADSLVASSPMPMTEPAGLRERLLQPSPGGVFILHLPGIGGMRGCDYRVIRALHAKLNCLIQPYDWTENDPGIHSLQAIERNHQEAAMLARLIQARLAKFPGEHIDIVAHSGGTAMAAWILEDLAPGNQLDNVVLLAPALSEQYDLSTALSHISGKMYICSSVKDQLVLDTGTRTFGTMDGIKTSAGGYRGFVKPATADAAQYTKLVPMPWQPGWGEKYDDWGDHLGATSVPFVQKIIVPLLTPVDGLNTNAPIAAPGSLPPQATTRPQLSARASQAR